MSFSSTVIDKFSAEDNNKTFYLLWPSGFLALFIVDTTGFQRQYSFCLSVWYSHCRISRSAYAELLSTLTVGYFKILTL